MKNEIQIKTSQGLQITSDKQLIELFNPKALMRSHGHLKKLDDVVNADKNSIAYYRANFKPETVELAIEMQLIALNASINTHEKLSSDQIEEITFEIMNSYYHLSIIEVGYVFRKAKRGDYGRINYAINMPDVLQWFDKYAEERCTYFMNRSESKGIENKQNAESSRVINEHALKMLKAFKLTLDENEKFNEEDFQEYKNNYNENNRKKN